ncbi:unnamed protein product [Absidia cylindrospora]
MTCSMKRWTVGLVFTKNKIEQSGFIGIEHYARDHGLNIVLVDLSQSIDNQGPFDLIVHKMTHVVSRMEQGDDEFRIQYERFITYCNTHPQVIVLDQWENIKMVLDRAKTFDYLCPDIGSHDLLFKIPEYMPLDSAKSIFQVAEKLSFPVMCKRRSACSSTEAHQMTIIPSAQHLTKTWTEHYGDKEPIIIQKFIQHDGVIIKVYVADGQIHVSTRPSFTNVTQDTDLIYFDSQKLPKTFDTRSPQDCLQKIILSSDHSDIQAQKTALLDHDILKRMADELQKRLKLTFFGFDVLLESGTNDYYIVDVNYFPSFKNVPHFQSIFVNILRKILDEHNLV